jgi:hypothetical protein
MAQDFAHLWKRVHCGASGTKRRWTREVAGRGDGRFLHCAVRFGSVCFRC